MLMAALIQLAHTANDKRYTRNALISELAREDDGGIAIHLADRLAELAPTGDDKRQARGALLALLAHETHPPLARMLANRVAQLDGTADDKRQARGTLLALLADATNRFGVGKVPIGFIMLAHNALRIATVELTLDLARLDPTADDKRQARSALLALLAYESEACEARKMVDALAQLDPTAEENGQARGRLLTLLAREDKNQAARAWEHMTAMKEHRWARERPIVVFPRDETAMDHWSDRERFIAALARGEGALRAFGWEDGYPEQERRLAIDFMVILAQSKPTIQDLKSARSWPTPPIPELLAAVRQNSPLTDWLTALPWIASLYD